MRQNAKTNQLKTPCSRKGFVVLRDVDPIQLDWAVTFGLCCCCFQIVAVAFVVVAVVVVAQKFAHSAAVFELVAERSFSPGI